jgi:hypothetical protein
MESKGRPYYDGYLSMNTYGDVKLSLGLIEAYVTREPYLSRAIKYIETGEEE